MAKEEEIPKELYYPQIITNTETSYVLFSIYERNNRSNGSEANNPLKKIFIYMPERASIPSTTSWDSENLGMVVGQTLPNLRDDGFMQGILNTIMESGEKGVTSGLDYMYFNSMSAAFQKLGFNASTGTLMGVVGQKIPNPHVALLFRGVNLRTFEFSFKLYPHNTKERDTIHQIIKCFRAYSLPQANETDFFLNYPPFFEIKYFFNKNENKYLNKFKKSSLVAVDTDYTASGMWSVTRDGFPTEINLTLRFSEEELVLRDDVFEEGF